MDLLLCTSNEPTCWPTILVFLFTVFYAIRVLTRARPHLPPGPKPLPFIGNVLQLPTEHIEDVFTEWANKYGAYIRNISFY